QRRCRPCLERLEGREVPAAITTDLRAGVLTVLGTGYTDQVSVNRVGGQLYVQGRTYTSATPTVVNKVFSSAAVKLIVVDADGGNDTVVVLPSVAQPARLYGGTGRDALYGGSGGDVLYGGENNDALFGRGGNDALIGGGGSDTLDGGAGSNKLVQESQ